MSKRKPKGPGVLVPLTRYEKTGLGGGDGFFWDYSDMIRDRFGNFLPAVEEFKESQWVRFRLRIKNREVCQSSREVSGRHDVPAREWARLARTVKKLKDELEQDSRLPKDSKRVLEQFRLPDVDKAPELYRLYGPRHARKLLILWGCRPIEKSAQQRESETEVGAKVIPIERKKQPINVGLVIAFVLTYPCLLYILFFVVKKPAIGLMVAVGTFALPLLRAGGLELWKVLKPAKEP